MAFQKKPVPGSLKAISMVVQDLYAAMHVYADVLGIGPWKVWKFDKGKGNMVFPDGKAVSCDFTMAAWTCPEVELRLIQPVEKGEDIFSRFLALHENGIHHIAFTQDREGIKRAVTAFKEIGDGELCRLIPENGKELIYVNAMRSMGYCVLLEDESFQMPDTNVRYPPKGGTVSPSPIKRIQQICCGIDEIQSRVRYCADNLGMAPWVCVHLTEECLTNIETGKTDPGNDFDCALYDGFPVQIEYTAPRVKGNFHSDYLETDGVQLHHIAVETDNFRQIVSKMSAAGGKLLSANYVDSTEISVFMDTRNTLGCFLQICEKCPGKGGKITEISIYQPSCKSTNHSLI
jgi:hypothetical protein